MVINLDRKRKVKVACSFNKVEEAELIWLEKAVNSRYSTYRTFQLRLVSTCEQLLQWKKKDLQYQNTL